MQIDPTAASAAAPQSDSPCASAEPHAGAAGAFAALLDEAAADTANDRAARDTDDDDQFDEMAALTMPSLLSVGVVVPPVIDPVVDEDVTTATDITDQAIVTDLTSRASLVDGSVSSQPTQTIGNDMGLDPNAMPAFADVIADAGAASDKPAADASTRAQTSATSEATANVTVASDAAIKAEASSSPNVARDVKVDDIKNGAAAPAGKAEASGNRAPKTGRASKAATSDSAKGATTPEAVQGARSPSASASPVAQAVDGARASLRSQQPNEVRGSGVNAARLARAIERAAAATSGDANSALAETQSGSQASGQQSSSSFGDGGNRSAQSFAAAVRQAATSGVTFTVAAPTAVDARTLAAAVGAQTSGLESGPASMSEHDVVAQLVQSMRVQFRDGIGEAIVKLKPEHLGSVQISLRVENGSLKATVQAENPAVRQWLESQQDTLRTGLTEHGLRLEQFRVEPDGEQSATADDAERQQQQEQQRRRRHRRVSEKDQPAFEVTV